jgi:hypothetical protein
VAPLSLILLTLEPFIARALSRRGGSDNGLSNAALGWVRACELPRGIAISENLLLLILLLLTLLLVLSNSFRKCNVDVFLL